MRDLVFFCIPTLPYHEIEYSSNFQQRLFKKFKGIRLHTKTSKREEIFMQSQYSLLYILYKRWKEYHFKYSKNVF